MINPQPGATIYEQVAAGLRRRITTGSLRPGQLLPSERQMAQELGVGRQTVGRAMKLLRGEGLVEYRRGKGVFVREHGEPADLTPAPGSTAVVRMPSAAERAALDLHEGVPVVAITEPGAETVLYPGDQWRLRWPG